VRIRGYTLDSHILVPLVNDIVVLYRAWFLSESQNTFYSRTNKQNKTKTQCKPTTITLSISSPPFLVRHQSPHCAPQDIRFCPSFCTFPQPCLSLHTSFSFFSWKRNVCRENCDFLDWLKKQKNNMFALLWFSFSSPRAKETTLRSLRVFVLPTRCQERTTLSLFFYC